MSKIKKIMSRAAAAKEDKAPKKGILAAMRKDKPLRTHY